MGLKLRNKEVLRPLALCISIYILLVVSLVHLTHTCRLYLPTNSNEIEWACPDNATGNNAGATAGEPCLACMFLKFLQATTCTALLVTLSIVLLALTLLPVITCHFLSFSLHRHIRGPPTIFSCPGI
jgi:hypothetical protein